MKKCFHCFEHSELWFELNSWVEGNKINLFDCGDCVVGQIGGRGGRINLKCIMWLNPEDCKYTQIQAKETMKACVAVDVKPCTFLILVLDGDEWLVSCLCHFNQRENIWYPLCRKLVGTHSWSGCFREQKMHYHTENHTMARPWAGCAILSSPRKAG